MLFAITCLDRRPEGLERRKAARPDHLAHVRALADKVLLAGPMTDDDGTPVGSLLVMDFPDRAAAEAFAEADPYAKADVFESVTIRPFTRVFPEA